MMAMVKTLGPTLDAGTDMLLTAMFILLVFYQAGKLILVDIEIVENIVVAPGVAEKTGHGTRRCPHIADGAAKDLKRLAGYILTLPEVALDEVGGDLALLHQQI